MKQGIAGSLLLLGLLTGNAANAVPPQLDMPGVAGFAARASGQAVVSFTANPLDTGDETTIAVNFCQSAPVADPVVRLKLGAGSYQDIAPGTHPGLFAAHDVSYTVSRGSATPQPDCPQSGTLDLLITLAHNHAMGPAETWHLRLEGMGDDSDYRVSAVDYADFTAIQLLPRVFDPSAITEALGPEGSPGVLLGGGSQATFWQDVAGPVPALTLTWSQTEGPPLSPLPTGDSLAFWPDGPDVDTDPDPWPSVSLDTLYRFELQVSSDFGEHEPLVNNAGVEVQVQPHDARDVFLVLDHSGSMLDENKWEITRQAASLFIDLYRGLRNDDSGAPGDAYRSRIGHLKFESIGCSWSASETPESDADLDVGLELTFLDAMGSFASVDTAYIYAPWGCTPIGDGVELARRRLATASPAVREHPVFVVMTDGLENAGKWRLDTPPHAISGAVASWAPVALREATFHTLGVGDAMVEESGLQVLAAATGAGDGSYRKATELASQQVQEFFVEILGDVLNAQQLDPLPGGIKVQRTFAVNRGETRLAFLLLWHRAQGGPYYPRISLAGAPWAADIHWDNAAGFPNVRRSHQNTGADGYAFLVVDGGPDTPLDGDWTVTFADAAGTAIGAVPPGLNPRIIAIADPYLYADFSFDRNVHETGDPIVLRTEIREGGRPVTGASVTVALVRPTEGEGSFLVAGSDDYDPRGSGKVTMAAGKAGDVLPPRKQMLAGLLSQLGKTALDKARESVELFDDGHHGDGAQDDGIYANVFTDTAKEGTYSFRYTASGTANSGTPFRRTGVRANYVGVKVNAANSPTATMELDPQDGLNRVLFGITPRDLGGEYLGPFLAHAVSFDVAGGTPVGEVLSRPDGSYWQLVAYAPGQAPVVVPQVKGRSFPPLGVPGAAAGGGWCCLLGLLLLALLLAVVAWIAWRLYLDWKVRTDQSA